MSEKKIDHKTSDDEQQNLNEKLIHAKPDLHAQSKKEIKNIQGENLQDFLQTSKKMPLKDKISLGPIEKYTIYNRFPYKFLLHICLLVLMSLTIQAQVQPNQAILRSQQYVWYKKFLLNQESEDVPVNDDFNREKRLFTISSVKEFVIQSLNNFYDMKTNPDQEFEDYQINQDASLFLIFTNNSIDNNPQNESLVFDNTTQQYNFPFDNSSNSEFQKWIENIKEFQIHYKDIIVEYPPESSHDVKCFNWTVNQRFYHTEQPQIRIQLDLQSNICQKYQNISIFAWLNFVTIFLAIASFSLELFQILQTVNTLNNLKNIFLNKQNGNIASNKDYKQTNKQNSKNQTNLSQIQDKLDQSEEEDDSLIKKRNKLMSQANWQDLLLSDKMRLIDIWSIISILANICQVIGSFYSMFRARLSLTTPDQILGVGCMLAWFTMLRYLMKTQQYKSMLASFQKAAPFVARALISMIPLFIGYAFLGMAIFWESRRFASFSISCYTLFALMHGDMIWDTYIELIQIDSLIAQIYLYTYIFVSICVIANIFTIIIEEGFMKQKYDSNYTWLLYHTQKHLINDDDSIDQDAVIEHENDGICVDSDVIISEYRLLYQKYKEQIKQYKEAIANLSLKQIINNEEEAWIQHRDKLDDKKQASNIFESQIQAMLKNNLVNNDSNQQKFHNYEFEQEILQLTEQLKDKVQNLKKDYRDLKLFKNEVDIASAREKLMVFLRKLIDDTNLLINQIQSDYSKNKRIMKKVEKHIEMNEQI